MSEDSARCPAPGALAEDGGDAGSAAPRLLLDSMRRLRARERGYLAGFLHDGPIQELAAATLELSETCRTMPTQPSDELGVVAQQVGAAGRSLRYLQDELESFTQPAFGLATALERRTAWLLAAPLAVDVGEGAAGLLEAEIQVVADVVELILADLVSPEAPARAFAAVRADKDLILLEMNVTSVPHTALVFGDLAAARASLQSLAAVIQACADIDLYGCRLRARVEITRRPR